MDLEMSDKRRKGILGEKAGAVPAEEAKSG